MEEINVGEKVYYKKDKWREEIVKEAMPQLIPEQQPSSDDSKESGDGMKKKACEGIVVLVVIYG